jgi:hypothetical protein
MLICFADKLHLPKPPSSRCAKIKAFSEIVSSGKGKIPIHHPIAYLDSSQEHSRDQTGHPINLRFGVWWNGFLIDGLMPFS